MTVREFLDAVKARVEKATEGPWRNVLLEIGPVDGPRVADAATEDDNPRRLFDAEFIAAARSDVPRLVAALEAVLAGHAKRERVLCGAMSEVPHRHGSEREPYPIRPVVCTEIEGHEGNHRDALCCWNFQSFDTAAAYKSAECADRSYCEKDNKRWPCPTVRAIEEALGGVE